MWKGLYYIFLKIVELVEFNNHIKICLTADSGLFSLLLLIKGHHLCFTSSSIVWFCLLFCFLNFVLLLTHVILHWSAFYCEGGRVHAKTTTHNWTLHESSGKREWNKKVYFSKSFNAKPAVRVSMGLIDIVNEDDFR